MRRDAARNLLLVSALAALCLTAAGGSGLADIPTRLKPGLWQAVLTMSMRMTMDGQTEMVPDRTGTMVMCSDGSLGAMENGSINGADNCTAQSTTVSGNAVNIVSSCPGYIGVGGTVITRETLVFESDTAMHMEASGASSMVNFHMLGDWKWQGACPAGMAPGDSGQMVGGNFERGSSMMAMPQQ